MNKPDLIDVLRRDSPNTVAEGLVDELARHAAEQDKLWAEHYVPVKYYVRNGQAIIETQVIARPQATFGTLLKHFLDGDEADSALGDLDEIFESDMRSSRLRAHSRYFQYACGLLSRVAVGAMCKFIAQGWTKGTDNG